MSTYDRQHVETYLEAIEKDQAVALIWTIDDVREIARAYDLTYEECMTVLKRLYFQSCDHDVILNLAIELANGRVDYTRRELGERDES